MKPRTQLAAVRDLMRDGRWRTLAEIHADVKIGISTRLRDLRKPKYGRHTVERHTGEGGVPEYRLLLATTPATVLQVQPDDPKRDRLARDFRAAVVLCERGVSEIRYVPVNDLREFAENYASRLADHLWRAAVAVADDA